MKAQFGIPNRIYFELFAGEHPSDKLYSVQVKDWEEFTNSKDVAAVVNLDLDQKLENQSSHLRVSPTVELVEFFQQRGWDNLPDELYVQKAAFEIVEGEVSEGDLDDDEYSDVHSGNSNKHKAIIATILAALAFLS